MCTNCRFAGTAMTEEAGLKPVWCCVMKHMVSCLECCPYVSGRTKLAAIIKWEAVSDLWLIGAQGRVWFLKERVWSGNFQAQNSLRS